MNYYCLVIIYRQYLYLGHECRKNEVELYIDAEYSHLQPAVRLIALALMFQYNTKFPVIFNTYQCYLKQSLSALASDIVLSENSNFYFGCKIVRGGNLIRSNFMLHFTNKKVVRFFRSIFERRSKEVSRIGCIFISITRFL